MKLDKLFSIALGHRRDDDRRPPEVFHSTPWPTGVLHSPSLQRTPRVERLFVRFFIWSRAVSWASFHRWQIGHSIVARLRGGGAAGGGAAGSADGVEPPQDPAASRGRGPDATPHRTGASVNPARPRRCRRADTDLALQTEWRTAAPRSA